MGGIHPDDAHPGFKNVLLRPNFVSGLAYFEAEHDGPFGKIVSSWKRSGSSVIYAVTVPANSSATITFPLANGEKVYQKNKPLSGKIDVNAGKYEFIIKKE